MTIEDMKDSEFALTEEEQAEIDAEERAENGEVIEPEVEVTQEDLDKLLNPKTEEKDTPDLGKEPDTNTTTETTTPLEEQQQDNHHLDTFQQKLDEQEVICNEYQDQIEGFEKNKNEILDQIEALGKEYDDGDMGEGAYKAKTKRLEMQLDEIGKKSNLAQQALDGANSAYIDVAQSQKNALIQQFNDELNKFRTENPTYNTDTNYINRFDEVLFDFRDKGVLVGMSYPQMLSLVKNRVELELGVPPKQEVSKDTKNGGGNKAIPKRENVNIPTGIHQLQATETNATGDEFGSLNHLNGLEYEAALEKLEKNNPEAYKRYMST